MYILCIQFSMHCTHWSTFPFTHYFSLACKDLAFAGFHPFSTYCVWLFICSFTSEENSIKFWSSAFGVCPGFIPLSALRLFLEMENEGQRRLVLSFDIFSYCRRFGFFTCGYWLDSTELHFPALNRRAT